MPQEQGAGQQGFNFGAQPAAAQAPAAGGASGFGSFDFSKPSGGGAAAPAKDSFDFGSSASAPSASSFSQADTSGASSGASSTATQKQGAAQTQTEQQLAQQLSQLQKKEAETKKDLYTKQQARLTAAKAELDAETAEDKGQQDLLAIETGAPAPDAKKQTNAAQNMRTDSSPAGFG